MIISASRRTDLPAAHAKWLLRRLREGFVLVRNPMNPHSVQRIELRPECVDGIVLWTKNPGPLLDRLDALAPYAYYFQYTLTAYGSDVEPRLPDHETRIGSFLRLSEQIGPERVLWRYDPILISARYPAEWHLEVFRRMAERLRGATRQVTVSFVDVYSRNRKRLEKLGVQSVSESEMRRVAAEIARIAASSDMTAVACSETIDLRDCGVAPACCVDAERLGRIGGIPLRTGKDPNQRAACGCAPSVDIGAYNTCPNGCEYCYANYAPSLLEENLRHADADSPLLCSRIGENDRITLRKMPLMRETQMKMCFERKEI